VREIEDLLSLMSRLRDPENGCPWDRVQSFETLVPYTIEEAYEVADAIARGDTEELESELGDLLFQVVFYARLADELNLFDFADVARSITEKMVRRHPHVFADVSYADREEQTRDWERIKAAERPAEVGSVLDGVPQALPAMTRAVKLQRRAARVGFDWNDVSPVIGKIEEELNELRAVLDSTPCPDRVEDELGDLLFACANLARHLGVDPEAATRRTNAKFEQRFRRIEQWLAEANRTLAEASLEEMDGLWERAKAESRGETMPARVVER
jgi:MazG family protein